MGTGTKAGLIISGYLVLTLGSISYYDGKTAYRKEPIKAVVISDAIRVCSAHGGIDQLKRTAQDVYDLQCKDGAWFLDMKLQATTPIKPAVLLKEIM